MPAARLNYVVIHRGDSQPYGSASKEIALTTPLPAGIPIEDRRVGFLTYQPDTDTLVFHPVPMEEVLAAELKEPAKRKKEPAADV